MSVKNNPSLQSTNSTVQNSPCSAWRSSRVLDIPSGISNLNSPNALSPISTLPQNYFLPSKLLVLLLLKLFQIPQAKSSWFGVLVLASSHLLNDPNIYLLRNYKFGGLSPAQYFQFLFLISSMSILRVFQSAKEENTHNQSAVFN